MLNTPGTRVTSTHARVRLGLPLHEAETETMYGAIPQARRVFNGYSGYAAPQHAALRDLLEQPEPRGVSWTTCMCSFVVSWSSSKPTWPRSDNGERLMAELKIRTAVLNAPHLMSR